MKVEFRIRVTDPVNSTGSDGKSEVLPVEKETSPKEPAPTVLKKTDPEERKEFVPNDLEESGPKDAKECGPKEPRVFAPKEPKELCVNTLDVLVDNMLTAVQDGDRNSLIAFLCIYPMCATIQQVLDVLFRWQLNVNAKPFVMAVQAAEFVPSFLRGAAQCHHPSLAWPAVTTERAAAREALCYLSRTVTIV
ncbi:Eukaryotic peptide chain release factor GTP-binding subunit ERF3A [Lemmus lemmus]